MRHAASIYDVEKQEKLSFQDIEDFMFSFYRFFDETSNIDLIRLRANNFMEKIKIVANSQGVVQGGEYVSLGWFSCIDKTLM